MCVPAPGSRQPPGSRPPGDLLEPLGRGSAAGMGAAAHGLFSSSISLTSHPGNRLSFPGAASPPPRSFQALSLSPEPETWNRNLTLTLSCFAGTSQHVLLSLSRECNYPMFSGARKTRQGTTSASAPGPVLSRRAAAQTVTQSTLRRSRGLGVREPHKPRASWRHLLCRAVSLWGAFPGNPGCSTGPQPATHSGFFPSPGSGGEQRC